MRKLLTRAAIIAALSGAGMTALADNVGMPYYARGPRIIHVPQPGDDPRDSQASLGGAASENADEDEVTPVAPQRAMKPLIQTRPKAQHKTVVKASVHKERRRRPYSGSLPEPPPPPLEPLGPRRALLSAPPPPPTSSVHDGPTPLRPTPRFAPPPPEPVASAPDSVTASMPAPEPTVSAPADPADDHLPPPGDPRLAPPEPQN